MKELFCEYNGYRELVLALEAKYKDREAAIKKLFDERDIQGIEKRAAAIKKLICDAVDDPELPRGPFEVISAGVLRFDGYRIEKILLQCDGHFSIPVNVYCPENFSGRRPTLLVPVGHWPEGKNMPDTQIMCANFAINGIIACTYDPVCQGERYLLPDSEVSAWFEGVPHDLRVVAMHGQLGNIAYMLGKNNAALFVRDGRAVLDYLCSRDDVDGSNIGCTGHSGGGTQTNYLSAVDDRIKYVSPVHCMSRMRAELPEGIGDSEQSLFGVSAVTGFDYADQAWACYPKPYMQSSAMQDQFVYEGARQNEEELRNLYSITGHGEDFECVYSASRHKNCHESRMASYSFFFRHMLNSEGPKYEVEITGLDEELLCGADRVLERPQADYIAAVREILRHKPTDKSETLKAVKNIIAYESACVCKEMKEKKSGKCVIYVGSDEAGAMKNITDAEEVCLFTPFAMDSALDKTMPVYDADSCTAYASNVLGSNVCRRRVHEVLREAEKKAAEYGELVLAGEGAGAWIMLLAGAVSGMKTVLIGLNENFESLFDKAVYFLPETNILDGILRAGDVSDIVGAADNVTLVDGNKGIFYAEINA